MCIRDRPDADGLQLLETIKKEKPDIAVIMISGHGSIDIACLLYTSDAADDLLCVDLGGRRIIKKKKNYI